MSALIDILFDAISTIIVGIAPVALFFSYARWPLGPHGSHLAVFFSFCLFALPVVAILSLLHGDFAVGGTGLALAIAAEFLPR